MSFSKLFGCFNSYEVRLKAGSVGLMMLRNFSFNSYEVRLKVVITLSFIASLITFQFL